MFNRRLEPIGTGPLYGPKALYNSSLGREPQESPLT